MIVSLLIVTLKYMAGLAPVLCGEPFFGQRPPGLNGLSNRKRALKATAECLFLCRECRKGALLGENMMLN